MHALADVIPRGYVERRGRAWWLRLPYIGPDGRRRQARRFLGLFRDVRTEAAARAVADAYLALTRRESAKPGELSRTGDLLERFLTNVKPSLGAGSFIRYARLLRRYAMPALASVPVSQVDTACIQGFFAALCDQGVGRTTLQGLRTVLLRALGEAREDGFMVPQILTKRIKIAGSAAREILPVSAHDLQRILAASSWPDKALYSVLGFSGLRISEALALRWTDIDFKAHTLRVERAVVRGKLQDPKTESSAAHIPMPLPLERVLVEYQRAMPPNALLLLFPSATGTPQFANNVLTRRLHPLLARLGLARRGFHAFRHGLPRTLFAAGVSTDLVRRFLRHRSLAQTETYVHETAADMRAALDAAAERLTPFAKPIHPLAKNGQGDPSNEPRHAKTPIKPP